MRRTQVAVEDRMAHPSQAAVGKTLPGISGRHLDARWERHHDASMGRTTVTIEDDLESRLQEFARRERLSFKRALDTLLRRGLGQQDRVDEPPFVVEPHSSAFRPGVDAGKLNQVLDHLEVDDFVRESAERDDDRP